MLQKMLEELNRLTSKYSRGTWTENPTANALVEVLMEHTFYLQMEINEVKSRARVLTQNSFLGPKTRDARRRLRAVKKNETYAGPTAQEKEESEELQKRLNKSLQREFIKKRRRVRKARERRKQAKINDTTADV